MNESILFATPEAQVALSTALEDMYYLLTRNYPVKASLALVGNRYNLVKRQQQALLGMGCSREQLSVRNNKVVSPTALKGQTIYIDGFNVLILLETLLSGGFVFKGLDGCYRDVSSVHGTYKTVEQTERALVLVGGTLHQLGVKTVVWVLDAPISNSGKLKTFCYEIAERYGFSWEVLLEHSPDKFLIVDGRLVCSSDAWVLDECTSWFNLAGYIIENMERMPATVVDIRFSIDKG